MWIQEITRELSISFLQGLHLGRIACAEGSQSYVTPFSFAYHGNFLYSFGTLGKKIAWMRANPLVCVEADTIISRAEWQSVVVFGRYEELPDTEAFHDARVTAHDVLATTANWWEPGYSKTLSGITERVIDPVYFRISVNEITGHRGMPGPGP
jgi:uncharacterized protein